MDPDLRFYTDAVWITIAVVWLVSAISTKHTEKTQQTRSRITQIILVCCAYILIFTRAFKGTFLGTRIFPSNAPIAYLGLALTIAGVCLALWARFFIGRNWSSDVTVKQDHQLIQNGPYRFVRHPIYSGFLLGLLGTAVVTNQLRAYLGLALAAIGWHLKASVEERFMTETFGNQYLRYKQQTKALIPFLL